MVRSAIIELIFLDAMDNCGLIDLGFKGPAHTWHRIINGVHRMSKQLERALADCD